MSNCIRLQYPDIQLKIFTSLKTLQRFSGTFYRVNVNILGFLHTERKMRTVQIGGPHFHMIPSFHYDWFHNLHIDCASWEGRLEMQLDFLMQFPPPVMLLDFFGGGGILRDCFEMYMCGLLKSHHKRPLLYWFITIKVYFGLWNGAICMFLGNFTNTRNNLTDIQL